MLLSASALMSILWGFLECLKALRMIVAFSDEMEMSEYCMGWEPEGEVVASLIMRKPWNKERNRVRRRYLLCRWNPMEGIALSMMCSNPLVMGKRISPLVSPAASPWKSFFKLKASIGSGIAFSLCR